MLGVELGQLALAAAAHARVEAGQAGGGLGEEVGLQGAGRRSSRLEDQGSKDGSRAALPPQQVEPPLRARTLLRAGRSYETTGSSPMMASSPLGPPRATHSRAR